MKRLLTPVALAAILITGAVAVTETPAPATPAAPVLGVGRDHSVREATKLRSDPRIEVLRTENRERRHRIARRKARAAAAAAAAAAREAAATAAAATPTYSSGSSGGALSQAQVASMLRSVGFPESVIPTMLYIIGRESGFNPGAINSSSGACGLTQLYPCPGPGALDPMTNLRYAYQKYAASGLSPWSM